MREGAILVFPVKVNGGGIYLGDMHAMQGDGEVAGHTTDVCGEVTLKVSLIKDLKIEGPILLPLVEDLPFLARPYSKEEKKAFEKLTHRYGQSFPEEVAPIQVIGSGTNINEAVDNGLSRMANLVGMSLHEVKNRITISGAVEIGRLPGIVTLTMMVPMKKLEEMDISSIVKKQYDL